MKYFLSLILLSVITISCAQDLKIISANKTAFYKGTSGFSGWNIAVKIKENAKNIVYQYLLKDGEKYKFEEKKLDSNQVELLTFEDLSEPILSIGEKPKKKLPSTNEARIFYNVGKNGTLKNFFIKEFKLVNSKNKALHP